MSASTSFDASDRYANDLRSREFADHWFQVNKRDLTNMRGLSYGRLLRLPVFLSKQEERSHGLWRSLLRAMFSSFGFCTRLLFTRSLPPPQDHDRTFIFLMSKSVPHGAISKHLEPIMRSLHSRGDTVVIWTFDEAARVALQAQFPLWRCENMRQAPIRLFEILQLASMFWRTSVSLLRSPHRGDYLQPLTTLFFYAPRFLALDAGLRTKLRPELVIISATEMHPMERFVFTRAKEKNIPTVLIQHGVTNKTIKNLVVNTPSIASRLCVWGEAAKRFFLASGVASERIHVTGSPAVSSLNCAPVLTPEETRSRYSLPAPGFILFSGQHFDAEKNSTLARMMLNAFASFLQTHPSAKLVITPHPAKNPSTTQDFYRQLIHEARLKEQEHVYLCPTKDDIYDLLRLSRVLVTSSSTLHVEASLLEIPVILLNVDEVADMEMVTQGAGLGAHNTSELVTALEASTQPHVRQQLAARRNLFLHEYMNLPGDAVTRVTQTILETTSPL